MEPKLPLPNLGPELPPANYGPNLEQMPNVSPEISNDRRSERVEHRAEASQPIAASNPILPPPVIPLTVPAISDESSAATQQADAPLVANDEDLIEKEWVDKAKKIIIETKDDPFRREQEVNKLQADYLRKRYGRELGASQ